MIDSDRLAETFTSLVKIDSLSRQEQNVSRFIEERLIKMGAQVEYDTAAEKVNGNCSNMVARFKGNTDVRPIFLSGHMDTVGPGEGIKPVFKDGIFKSDGTTILGSDNKSAIAIILEVMTIVLENNLPYPPLELVFTVCEEIGLLGAKHFDYGLLTSEFGYILDSTDTEGIVTRAPAANKITIRVFGKAAHAGAAPENGVSAISVASKAICGLELDRILGRIDEETTCNIGTIEGGMATNIVPDFVEIHGEARSHDEEKLKGVTDKIINAFHDSARAFKESPDEELPKVIATVDADFPATHIPEDHPVIRLARKAADNLGMSLSSRTIGGGADANIFFGKGMPAGVLGTGMTDVHTLKESIALKDMENTALLILEILKVRAAGDQI